MTLTKNQRLAIEKFSQLKVGALFMQQGTGKTRVAIELINSTDSDFVLFVCPFSTIENLKQELDKWGFEREHYIIGYETLSASDKQFMAVLAMLEAHERVFVVADESIFIKNDKNRRYRRMLEIRDRSEYRLILNGTPITKDEWDIYNQMNFLSEKIFNMSREEFLQVFFKKISYKKRGLPAREFYKLSDVNSAYLQKMIAPYVFQVDLEFTKGESINKIMITSGGKAEARYKEQKRWFLERLVAGEVSVEDFTAMVLTCFSDAERHKAIARHLQGYGQTIVFCSLLDEVANIRKVLDCYVITGATPREERKQIIEQFKHDDKPLLMTYGVGAFGLNLQFCHKMAFASLTFDYAKVEQAISRIKRLGQESDIEYTYFTSDLGIYSLIEENLDRKQSLKDLIAEKIEEGGEALERVL